MIVRDEEFRKEWSHKKRFCQVCGIRDGAYWIQHAVHHIIGGPGRSDEATNLLKVCWKCHGSFHLERIVHDGTRVPQITRGMILKIKRVQDGREYDAARLEELYGFPLPAEEDLPTYFTRHQRRMIVD